MHVYDWLARPALRQRRWPWALCRHNCSAPRSTFLTSLAQISSSSISCRPLRMTFTFPLSGLLHSRLCPSGVPPPPFAPASAALLVPARLNARRVAAPLYPLDPSSRTPTLFPPVVTRAVAPLLFSSLLTCSICGCAVHWRCNGM